MKEENNIVRRKSGRANFDFTKEIQKEIITTSKRFTFSLGTIKNHQVGRHHEHNNNNRKAHQLFDTFLLEVRPVSHL